MTSQSRARLWIAIAHSPVLVILWAVFTYVRNHFYVVGPFLFDSGWFSALVYRNGLMPRSPPSVAWDVIYYWGWHPSILISVGSALSYVFPGDRVEWYCVFQAAIFAPLAFSVPLLVRKETRLGWSSALLTAVCSLAFAFSGQVLSCAGYPHFEIFSAAGCCIMLASLASGRPTLAAVGLGMSIATREDGGLHAGMFLLAVLACDLSGRPFPVARRRVLVMTLVAFAMTGILVGVQKLFVHVDAWKYYISGEPPYAHLTKALLQDRWSNFSSRCGFIWLPFAATVVAAIVRRDARYLLGWLVTSPWFFLNLTALQIEKGYLALYAGFPFIGSAFWVGAYAHGVDKRATATGWRWAVVAPAILGASSLFALQRAHPWVAAWYLRDMTVPRDRNPDGLRAFARELRTRQHGVVRMDPAMASWAVEAVRLDELVNAHHAAHGLDTGDAFALWGAADSLSALVRSPFSNCGRVPRTAALFCTRAGKTLPAALIPAFPLLDGVIPFGEHSRRDGATIVVEAAAFGGATIGPFLILQPGKYVASWHLEFGRCETNHAPGRIVDVVRGGRAVVAPRPVSPGERDVAVEFDVAPPEPGAKDERWEMRTFTGACSYVIHGLELRRSEPTPAPL